LHRGRKQILYADNLRCIGWADLMLPAHSFILPFGHSSIPMCAGRLRCSGVSKQLTLIQPKQLWVAEGNKNAVLAPSR
jgi:hypothetical protein